MQGAVWWIYSRRAGSDQALALRWLGRKHYRLSVPLLGLILSPTLLAMPISEALDTSRVALAKLADKERTAAPNVGLERQQGQHEEGLDAAERAIRQYAGSHRLLGDRYAHIATGRLFAKNDLVDRNLVRATYFSHSRNRTIELVLDGGTVKVLKDTAASTYQPELAPQEIRQAVSLARDELLSRGLDRVSSLDGYGILPHRMDVEHGFYKTRMVYVSFHAHENEPPEFAALIDLTRRQVIETRTDP